MDIFENSVSLLKSPGKPRYTDRFIPARAGKAWDVTFPETPTKQILGETEEDSGNEEDNKKITRKKPSEEKVNKYACVLKNEVLGYDFDSASILESPKRSCNRTLFHYDSAERPLKNMSSDRFSAYSSTPVSTSTQKLLKTPLRKRRRIPKTPYKVLDAPELSDDFYLNLVDWSSQDIISVGLGPNVYLWSSATSQVQHIVDMSELRDRPTSVKWNEHGTHLAYGSNDGVFRIWDIEAKKAILERRSHQHRIGVIDWKGDTIFTGSRDRVINISDFRSSSKHEMSLQSHTHEICGLKWSAFNSCLASGGNDNAVLLWNLHSSKPYMSLTEHVAAVKALSWSPHVRHVLASGGGTQDRCIKFWNTITGSCVGTIDTNSQVCNVVWSPFSNEIASTHGYAHNHIAIWKYPSQKLVATLKGHTQRVLFMSLSPDGESICTGASDETLRFWKIFQKVPNRVKKSSLHLFEGIR